jgi:hypothetical protein
MITTGKTSFLYMLLIKRLLCGKPTFFQTMGGTVYYVSDVVQRIDEPDVEARIIDPLQDASDVVALVDADGKSDMHTPHCILLYARNIRVILTSFPRGPESKRWLKQSNVPEGLRVRMMDIWSEAELFIAA